MGAPLVIGLDGDDTLWHSETLFVETQRQILELFGDDVSEAFETRLLETERRNLSVFGYGAKGFTLSTIETIIELTDGEVAAKDIHRIVELGKELLAHPVDLLDDVAEVVEELAGRHRLVLVTKGDLFHQESKVAASGLADRFWRVEIVSEKAPQDYRRVLDRHEIAPGDFVMVGNSVRSDILAPIEVGARAVHVPYTVTWAHERVDPVDQLAGGYVRIDKIGELPGIIASM